MKSPKPYGLFSAEMTGRPAKRVQQLHPRSIECAECGAAAGQQCVTATGTKTSAHRIRERMYARFLNETRK